MEREGVSSTRGRDCGRVLSSWAWLGVRTVKDAINKNVRHLTRYLKFLNYECGFNVHGLTTKWLNYILCTSFFTALWWTVISIVNINFYWEMQNVLLQLYNFNFSSHHSNRIWGVSWNKKGNMSLQIPTQTKPFSLPNWIQLKGSLLCWSLFQSKKTSLIFCYIKQRSTDVTTRWRWASTHSSLFRIIFTRAHQQKIYRGFSTMR